MYQQSCVCGGGLEGGRESVSPLFPDLESSDLWPLSLSKCITPISFFIVIFLLTLTSCLPFIRTLVIIISAF